MKRKIAYMTVCAVAMALLMAACDIETSGNGDLDGYWSLRQIDTLSTASATDVSERRIFWSVQHTLLQTDDRTGAHLSYLFRFQHSGNTLVLSSPYVYGRENGDDPIDDVEVLRPYGINAIPETFTVEKLNGSSMVLHSELLRLHFKRY